MAHLTVLVYYSVVLYSICGSVEAAWTSATSKNHHDPPATRPASSTESSPDSNTGYYPPPTISARKGSHSTGTSASSSESRQLLWFLKKRSATPWKSTLKNSQRDCDPFCLLHITTPPLTLTPNTHTHTQWLLWSILGSWGRSYIYWYQTEMKFLILVTLVVCSFAINVPCATTQQCPTNSYCQPNNMCACNTGFIGDCTTAANSLTSDSISLVLQSNKTTFFYTEP